MSRIRTIKPSFFRHEGLFEAEKDYGLPLRVAYAGLWTVADREGRFQWRPRALKLDCLPYDEVDFSRVLDALATRGFIVKYASHGEYFGLIPSFSQHQIVNNRESPSTLPEPENTIVIKDVTRAARVTHASSTRHDLDQVEQEQEGKGKKEKIYKKEKPATPFDILKAKLTEKTASDVIEHRKALKKPLTPRAAEGLVNAFEAFGDPERAAEAMIVNGWQGFKPEWMQANGARAGPLGVSGPNGHQGRITAFSRPTVGEEISAFQQSAARHEATAARLRAEIEADKQKSLELGNGTVRPDRS